ncbi:MAG: C39 family peptidase [Acidaminococcus sp.]|jgi:hypothetical protein|nr:C39 family peptidase [Acidaminococcus sp.]MCI2100060.1 C39 family peptidase [Acidaminococcus sp.]MCI2114342.1 C39 family peptidase [Acidaminococcus sp.]MCI2116271.1 C39 family peptidase [Acidaminococcus sp.]
MKLNLCRWFVVGITALTLTCGVSGCAGAASQSVSGKTPEEIEALLKKAGGGAASVNHAADIKDSPYFKAVDVYNLKSQGSLTVISHYKTHQQETEYTCGPAAAYTVMTHFLGKSPDSEMTIAKIMDTHPAGMADVGTNTRGMVRYFEKQGWKVRSALSDGSPKDYSAFKKFVLDNLQAGIPTMIENIDWDGHWRVIIGFDTMGDTLSANDVLILADPYDTSDHCQDGYNIASAERFFSMWFDSHLFREGEKERQWLTAVPSGYVVSGRTSQK